jgi:DNA-binding SARP family transcriptional activator/TolB-like protein
LGLKPINILGSNDFQLITLGRLALLAPPGMPDASLGRQRRKLAVLAVLALHRGPVPRDTLIEMFWGDQDEARARHSLSEALSHLRRTLGRDAVTTRQAEVALAEKLPLRVDATEFTAAVKEGAYGRALELYGGPFLEAVYVGGSSFEEWTDRERRRLEELFLRACDEQCEVLAREERWEECARVARRWAEADPLSVDAAAALLDALAAPGTREAQLRALREYEHIRARAEREYGLSPAPALAALAGRIRERIKAGEVDSSLVQRANPELPPTVQPNMAEPTRSGTEPPVPAPVESLRTASSTEECHPAAPAAAPHRPGLARWAGVALVVLAALGALLLYRRDRPVADPGATSTVVVLPFAVHGGAEIDYLRGGLVDLLSTSLDGAGALRSVDPRVVIGTMDEGALTPAKGRALAERFGAGQYVLGDVVAAGEQIRITAALYEVRRAGKPLVRATVEGAPSQLFQLVDRLTAQLLAAQSRTPTDQLTPIAAVTTSSLPALKSYLEGESHYRGGRYIAAFEAFQQAAAQDSAFALAYYRMTQSAPWGGLMSWDSLVEHSEHALRHAGRLNRRTRLLVEALHAWHRGAHDAAERLYRTVVATHPSDLEAWYQLGEVRFHSGPLRGRSILEAREPLERVLSLEPDHLPALLHLVRVAAREGKRAEVDSLVRRAKVLMPDADETWIDAFRAFAVGGPAEQDAAVERLRSAPDEIVRISAERVAIYTGDLEGAERMLEILVQPPRLPEARALGHVQLAELELARGRWRAGQPHFAAAAQLAPALALEHRALLSALPFAQRPRAEIEALRDTLLAWTDSPPPSAWPVGAVYDGRHPHLRQYLIGVLSVRLGDSAAADRSARALDEMRTRGDAQSREFARGLAESVRAHAAAARGQHRQALAGFERGRLSVSEGLLESPFGSQTLERFARAEALRALGRDAEAIPWYASLAESLLHQVVYRAPAHLRLAEIHEKLGQPRRAARHYRAFLELWNQSDPEFRPQVEQARSRLDRLRAP